jgi:hypothetical protein
MGSGPPEMALVASLLESHGAIIKRKDNLGTLFWELERDGYLVQLRTRPKGDIFEYRKWFRKSFKWLPVDGPIQLSLQTFECCDANAATVIGQISAEMSGICGRGIWVEATGGTQFNMLVPEGIADLRALFEYRARRLARSIGWDVIPPRACRTSEECQEYLNRLEAQSSEK